MRKPYVRSILTVLILTLVELIAFAANDSPQTFTLDGQLYASDRTSPLLDATAKIRVQILDPSKNCILYEEEQPVDTTSSGGHFSIQVGSVVGSIKRKAMDAGNTMQKVYQNSSAIAASGVSCSGTYSPVMGAIRYVRVIVTPTAGSPNTLSPDMVMDAVPNAMVAQSVQGLERENILQTNPAVLLTQLKLEQFFQSLTSGAGNGVKFDGTNFVAYDPSNGNNLSPSSVPDTAIGSVG